MKKIAITLIAWSCIVSASVNAQVNSDSTKMKNPSENYKTMPPNGDQPVQNPQTLPQQQDLIKVRSGELPAMVTQTLAGTDYQGWTISNAYRTSENDQYKVDVKKGAQVKTFWFDKNGNRLDSAPKSNPNKTDIEGNKRPENKTGNEGAPVTPEK